MGEAAGLRPQTPGSQRADWRQRTSQHSRAGRTPWRTLKGASTLGRGPSCKAAHETSVTFTTCHLAHPVAGHLQLMGKGLLQVLFRQGNIKRVNGWMDGWMDTEEHVYTEAQG